MCIHIIYIFFIKNTHNKRYNNANSTKARGRNEIRRRKELKNFFSTGLASSRLYSDNNNTTALTNVDSRVEEYIGRSSFYGMSLLFPADSGISLISFSQDSCFTHISEAACGRQINLVIVYHCRTLLLYHRIY